MRTFTPAVQALVGLIIVPYSRQLGMDGTASPLTQIVNDLPGGVE
ncbi:hypothetical protein [Paraburkholderia dipogonis]